MDLWDESLLADLADQQFHSSTFLSLSFAIIALVRAIQHANIYILD